MIETTQMVVLKLQCSHCLWLHRSSLKATFTIFRCLKWYGYVLLDTSLPSFLSQKSKCQFIYIMLFLLIYLHTNFSLLHWQIHSMVLLPSEYIGYMHILMEYSLCLHVFTGKHAIEVLWIGLLEPTFIYAYILPINI